MPLAWNKLVEQEMPLFVVYPLALPLTSVAGRRVLIHSNTTQLATRLNLRNLPNTEPLWSESIVSKCTLVIDFTKRIMLINQLAHLEELQATTATKYTQLARKGSSI